jgi:prolyl-tRNA synthetase
MRWSRYHLPTTRDVPKNAGSAGRQLMLRAGLVKRIAPGLWGDLPFGWRSVSKLAALVRRELDAAGALEVHLPASAAIADLVRHDLRSYRQLPVTFYRIDGRRMDAASFHAGAESLDAAREALHALCALCGRIFAACRLSPLPIETFGGSLFLVPAESGETAALRCPRCGYAAASARAETRLPERNGDSETEIEPLREVVTPGMKTVEAVARFLGVPAWRLVKTLIYETDAGLVAALVRGDREMNEAKLAHHLGVSRLHLAGEEAVRVATQAPVGFAGPVGLHGIRLVADETVLRLTNFVCGGNRVDVHYVDANWGRDVGAGGVESADLLRVAGGDPCPRCDGVLEPFRGIAVGETVQSAVAGSAVADASGAERPLLQESCILDIAQIVAAAIEQSHDQDGILWPRPLAPFEVLLTGLNPADEAVAAAADRFYGELLEKNVEVLYDDRDERPGVKLKDADLLGLPVRLVAGARSLAGGTVEISLRRDREKHLVPVAEAVSRVLDLLMESSTES